ncbi:hypothetical protein EDC32_102236 [Laceyella sacchari]|nr:hypothetical protein [Laceyella sacchari]TCW38996.1 hypothetical protein EDC32_102236 [Laceyella sacchari]
MTKIGYFLIELNNEEVKELSTVSRSNIELHQIDNDILPVVM